MKMTVFWDVVLLKFTDVSDVLAAVRAIIVLIMEAAGTS
jgi:hypothetical protein